MSRRRFHTCVVDALDQAPEGAVAVCDDGLVAQRITDDRWALMDIAQPAGETLTLRTDDLTGTAVLVTLTNEETGR